MEEGEGSGLPRLSKRFSDKGAGEVDYKNKAGTAWSHNYLNQKPWHPLSYPNQRRKWIAEQTHSQRQRRAEEVAREFSQEQEFFRQTALVSKKEKEKMETMKAVSFMYVRPPGYNAESAKAAEIADEKKNSEQNNGAHNSTDAPSTIPENKHGKDSVNEDKRKVRPKDVFGRTLPTEEEFEVLKNAPRLETGVPGRAKPFGVEIRNVRCVRCGTYGHQSGDRECPLKDAIMPNDETRLKRDDPLTAIVSQTDPSEPLKWELKQRPGLSPPRGGFSLDNPNQQIVAEDIFDEYGGFLSGGDIPLLLTSFKEKKSKKHSGKKSKHKQQKLASCSKSKVHIGNSSPASSDTEVERESRRSKDKYKRKKCHDRDSDASISSDSDSGNERRKSKTRQHNQDSDAFESPRHDRHHRIKRPPSYSDSDSENVRRKSKSNGHNQDMDASKSPGHDRHRRKRPPSYSDSDGLDERRKTKSRQHNGDLDTSESLGYDSHNRSKRPPSYSDSDLENARKKSKSRRHDRDLDDRHHRSKRPSSYPDSISENGRRKSKSKRKVKDSAGPSTYNNSDSNHHRLQRNKHRHH